MKSLIIPDVHNKTSKVKKLLAKIGDRFDQVIQLGDLFDDFGDNAETVAKVAADINFLDANYPMVYLWGNHDLPYRYPSKYTWCPGFTLDKQKAIIGTLDKPIWDKFKFYLEVDNYLLSHAGFNTRSIHLTNPPTPTDEWLLEDALHSGYENEFWWIGPSRGGNDLYGGPLWLDWDNEFRDIENVPQIVGHTPHKTPQWKGRSLCLDTHLNDYATIEDGKLEVHEWQSFG